MLNSCQGENEPVEAENVPMETDSVSVNKSDSSETSSDSDSIIRKVLFVCAQEDIAMELAISLGLNLNAQAEFHVGTDWKFYAGDRNNMEIGVVALGKYSTGERNFGLLPLSLLAFAAAELLNPDLIINLGKATGTDFDVAQYNQLFLASSVRFLEPNEGLPVFESPDFGLQNWQPQKLIRELGFRTGCLYSSAPDSVLADDAVMIDKEGAAVAYSVCYILNYPTLYLKHITEIVDEYPPEVDSNVLITAAMRIIDYVAGKTLDELD
ncbi:hypothetical protein OROGR_021395 [Orobanche gracilis]